MRTTHESITFDHAQRVVLAVSPSSWELVDTASVDDRTVSGVLRCSATESKCPAFYVEIDPLSGHVKTATLERLEERGEESALSPDEVKLSPSQTLCLACHAQKMLLESEAQIGATFGKDLEQFRRSPEA